MTGEKNLTDAKQERAVGMTTIEHCIASVQHFLSPVLSKKTRKEEMTVTWRWRGCDLVVFIFLYAIRKKT